MPSFRIACLVVVMHYRRYKITHYIGVRIKAHIKHNSFDSEEMSNRETRGSDVLINIRVLYLRIEQWLITVGAAHHPHLPNAFSSSPQFCER